MSSYVPAYKIGNYPGQGQGSAGASPEGINAFLSRIKRAQVDADRADDLRIQEQVASGTISIDDQIKYNEKRQARFLPSTEEFQQLQNNIADLNVAKKWQVLSTMDAGGQPKTAQIKYLAQWAGELTPGSDLKNQISDRVGKLQIQANQDEYARVYESKKAAFSQGQLDRKEVVSYLQGQLQSTNDETLRAIIQGDLDTQQKGLLDDSARFRDATIAQFDRTGNAQSEGTYLGLLEDSQTRDIAAGDAASAAARSGEIDTQKRYLAGVTIDGQLNAAYAELLNKPGTAANEKYLSTLRTIQGQQSGDFAYMDTNGHTKNLHLNNLQSVQMNAGAFSGDTLANGVNKQLSQFITNDYIPDKAQETITQFNKMSNLKGANYDQLFAQAQKLSEGWNTFKSQDFLAPFAASINKWDTVDNNGVQGTILLGLTAALGNNFSSGKESDQGTLQKLESVQKLFPAMSGVDFQEKVAIPLQQKIGTQNFNKFIEVTNLQFSEQINQIQAAKSILGSKLTANQIDQPTYASQTTQLEKDLLATSNAQGQFGKQYTGAGGDSYIKSNYGKFLPDKGGRYQQPKVNIPARSTIANQYAPYKPPKPAPIGSGVGASIKVQDPKYLSGYREDQLDRRSDGIYLKPGVPKNW